MNAARPRHSVLALFDPLLAVSDPATPPRNISSPDSDKENVNTLTAFFNRTYNSSHPQPPQLKNRLIDVGNATLDDFSINASLIEEDGPDAHLIHDSDDDENDTLTFRHMTEAATPKCHSRPTLSATSSPSFSAPRTPLADLPLEHDTTPLARSKVYRRPVVPHLSNLSQMQPITAQELSSESAVKPATPIASQPSGSLILPIHITHDDLPISSSESLSSSVCTLNLETPTGTLLTDTPLPAVVSPPPSNSIQDTLPVPSLDRSKLRPNPSSSANSNRCSVDLQSSFQLQLESADATFDLLNDKISFLGSKNDMDSFFDALEGEGSFDMSTEQRKLESVLKSMKDEETDGALPKIKTSNEDLVARKPISQERRCFDSLGPAKRASLSKALPTANLSGQQDLEKPSPVAVPAKSLKPPLLFTPSSKCDLPRVPPPVVPALKIVKRAKVSGHLKSNSTSSTSSSEEPTLACTGVDLVSARAIPPVSTTGRLPVSRGVPPNFARLGSGNLRAVASKNNAAPSGPSVPAVSAPVVSGARRVLISDGPSLQPQPRSRIVANSIQSRGDPFRQQPAPVSNILTKPLAVGGLKRPAKYGSSVGTISNLPKPVSQSRTSKLPATGVRNGGGSLPARRAI